MRVEANSAARSNFYLFETIVNGKRIDWLNLLERQRGAELVNLNWALVVREVFDWSFGP